MFVKDAYQKRLRKEEEDIGKLISLKKQKPPKIGSVKNDKLNYDRQEQFFSRQDVPIEARTIKEAVKTFIDPDYLGLRQKQWNTSVSVPKKFEEDETHEQKLLKIKLGFFDHPDPKYKAPLVFPGTETRDDYTKWNVSNEILRKELNQNLSKTTKSAFNNTRQKQAQIIDSYLNPLARTTNFIESNKQQILNEAEMREKLKELYVFEHPTASIQKINGAVFRLAYETKVKEMKDEIEGQAMKTDFKATLLEFQKKKIAMEYSHSGIWQKFQGEEDLEAWSCCMNEDPKSPGCVHRVRDANKWNLISYNNL